MYRVSHRKPHPEADMENGLLSEKQAADFLQLTPRALQAWRTRGGGPSYLRIGHRTVRYLRADLEDFLESRRFSNTAEETRYAVSGAM